MDTSGRLQALQKHPANIRNICILAHVDHGKHLLIKTPGPLSSSKYLPVFAHCLSVVRENDSCGLSCGQQWNNLSETSWEGL